MKIKPSDLLESIRDEKIEQRHLRLQARNLKGSKTA